MEVARRYTKAENCAHMAGEDGLWKARTITRNCFTLMPSFDVSYASKLLTVGRGPTDDFIMNYFYGLKKTSDRDLTTVQIQRNGGPNRAPTTCEDLSTNAFLSGQTGDDLTEDTVWEVGDAVQTRLLFLILGSSRRPSPFPTATAKPPDEGVAGGASLALLVLGAPE